MKEVRVMDSRGNLIPTALEKTTPKAINHTNIKGGMVLAEYCFNDSGNYLETEEVLRPADVAMVVYEGHRMKSMTIMGDKIEDGYDRRNYMRFLATECVMTPYRGKDRKDIFMFYIPAYKRSTAKLLKSNQIKPVSRGDYEVPVHWSEE
jgi:hypothetical protein